MVVQCSCESEVLRHYPLTLLKRRLCELFFFSIGKRLILSVSLERFLGVWTIFFPVSCLAAEEAFILWFRFRHVRLLGIRPFGFRADKEERFLLYFSTTLRI